MRILRWIVGLGVVFYLLTGVVEVRRGERAVVRRFGRILPEHPEPGLWIGLPWGMDRVDRVAVDTVRTVEVGYRPDADLSEGTMPVGQLLSGDHNLVNVQAVLYYRVRPEAVTDYLLAGAEVPRLLERAVEVTMARWVASRDVDEVLLEGKNALRAELIARVGAMVEPYRLGVEVLDARVARIGPPDEVRDAFESVTRAQMQNGTLRNRAEQEAQSRQRQARAEQYRVEQTALAYAHGKRVVALEDARRFQQRLGQYRAAKETNPNYLNQLWQEERGKLFTKMKEGGQIDLLDHHLSGGGLDLLTAPRLQGPRR